jgi:tripartite-type tricarboxylate transporter receptor subunit TctC
MNKALKISAAATAIALASCLAVSGQEGAAFFDGKTVNYIVATAPGAVYDSNGRLLAEYMQKHLPGSTFVVRNMEGAGGFIGANYVYSSAPDGLTIGSFNPGLIYSQLTENPTLRLDLTKMSWIGKLASDPRIILVTEQSGVESIQQLQTQEEAIKFSLRHRLRRDG